MNTVMPASIDGVLLAPSSKSMMQRAVAAAMLAQGQSLIAAPSFCQDGLASMRVARALGATIEETEQGLLVQGGGRPTGQPLDCGEAGFSMRMFSAIAALYDQELILQARGSLARRPMEMVTALRDLGVRVETTDGHAPISIHGPLRGGKLEVDGSASSQFLSGLLMALPLCQESTELRVKNLKSKPYVHMTLELLRDFGLEIRHDPELTLFSVPGGQRYHPRNYTVEGDWSGASFLLVAGAIAGRMTVQNLRLDSRQADRAIMDALALAGAKLEMQETSVTVATGQLHGFSFDATHCPDLFPPLVALASQCQGETLLDGANRLANKESDRKTALCQEFAKLGIDVSVSGDRMRVVGGPVRGALVSSHEDHRIAMACAIAALKADGPVQIEGAGCVAKSYPEFFEDLESIKEHL